MATQDTTKLDTEREAGVRPPGVLRAFSGRFWLSGPGCTRAVHTLTHLAQNSTNPPPRPQRHSSPLPKRPGKIQSGISPADSWRKEK